MVNHPNRSKKKPVLPASMRMTLLECAELLAEMCVYNIRNYERTGDDEGARLQSFTLLRVRDAIARAK